MQQYGYTCHCVMMPLLVLVPSCCASWSVRGCAVASALSFKLVFPLVNQESFSVFPSLSAESSDAFKPTFGVAAHSSTPVKDRAYHLRLEKMAAFLLNIHYNITVFVMKVVLRLVCSSVKTLFHILKPAEIKITFLSFWCVCVCVLTLHKGTMHTKAITMTHTHIVS